MKDATRHNTIRQTRGFTLVETLVSISIFSISIVALLSVTSSGVSNLNYVKNKLTASYLAQEGLEKIRNLRDTSAINDPSASGWTAFLGSEYAGECLGENGCRIPSTGAVAMAACSSGGCPPLRRNTSNGYFAYNGSFPPSPFTRTITVAVSENNPEEVLVISVVAWRQGSATHEVEVSGRLFDWR